MGLSNRIFTGLVFVLGVAAITACAEDRRHGMKADTIAASPGATRGVCARNTIPGQSPVVLVVAIFKDGKTANFLCDVGYGAAAGRPEAKPQDFRPAGLRPGPLVDLPTYQKWQDETGDPCILLTSGGRKQYYCW